MFERYTEQARRVLFFARYEASQLGSRTIDSEHLLLGLIREGKGLTGRVFASLSLPTVRTDVERRVAFHEKLPTSVEIPFSDVARRVLEGAAEEADRLRHPHIGSEHLLLGLLRETSPAASVLSEHGLRLDEVRTQIEADSDEVKRVDALLDSVHELQLRMAHRDEARRRLEGIADQLRDLRLHLAG